jgi:hypothetical protein
VIMDASPECWTNQQSILEFGGQWYLFYHHNDLSPNFDKNRSVRIDSLFFNDDGTIRKVIPTLRGVGVTDASSKIQIDRYSSISGKGASVGFLDTLNRSEGWKAILDTSNAWIQYNGVDFGSRTFSRVDVRAASKTGGTVQVRLNKMDGPIIAEIEIPVDTDWKIISSPVAEYQPGVINLIVRLKKNGKVAIDWITLK